VQETSSFLRGCVLKKENDRLSRQARNKSWSKTVFCSLQKLEAYYSWALSEPRIGGFCPWHYANRAGDGDPGDVCDMMPGVVAFPAVLARLKEIGAAENAFVLRAQKKRK
jgi:hypothetical protein